MGKSKRRHGKGCQCSACFKLRKRDFLAKVRLMDEPRPPAAPDQLVPVRAHWRRQSTAYSKDDALRRFVLALVRGMVAPTKRKR